jgi:hypothetical protein
MVSESGCIPLGAQPGRPPFVLPVREHDIHHEASRCRASEASGSSVGPAPAPTVRLEHRSPPLAEAHISCRLGAQGPAVSDLY